MKRFSWAIFAVAVFFSGCAYVPKSSTDCDLKAKQFIATEGKSSIYIFRNKRLSSGVSIRLLVDGKITGNSEPYTYFRVDLEPGEHKINCEDNSNTSLIITTKLGQIYFVRQLMKNGFSSVSCQFEEVAETIGKNTVNGCDLVQNIP